MKYSHTVSEEHRLANRGRNPSEMDLLFEALADEASRLSEELVRYSVEHMPQQADAVECGQALIVHFRERFPDLIEPAYHSLAVLVFTAARDLPVFEAVRILVNKPDSIDDTPRNRAIASAFAMFFKTLKS